MVTTDRLDGGTVILLEPRTGAPAQAHRGARLRFRNDRNENAGRAGRVRS
jgi:hypothetical protein